MLYSQKRRGQLYIREIGASWVEGNGSVCAHARGVWGSDSDKVTQRQVTHACARDEAPTHAQIEQGGPISSANFGEVSGITAPSPRPQAQAGA